jgi:hypothetical protein
MSQSKQFGANSLNGEDCALFQYINILIVFQMDFTNRDEESYYCYVIESWEKKVMTLMFTFPIYMHAWGFVKCNA